MKFDWNGYFKPTPKLFRKVGDALLGVSMMGVGFAIVEESKWIAITLLVTGVVGKFLTNFFKEDESDTDTTSGT